MGPLFRVSLSCNQGAAGSVLMWNLDLKEFAILFIQVVGRMSFFVFFFFGYDMRLAESACRILVP